MKAIQFKKIDCPVSGMNDKEIMKEFGGVFEFEGLGHGNRITIFKPVNGQEKLIRLGDWLLEIDGAIVVLNNEEYQLLQSEQQLNEIKDRIKDEVKQYKHRVHVGLIKPQQTEHLKDLGQSIRDSIKVVIKRQGRVGGDFLDLGFAPGGYVKPPYITEMEDQIKVLSTVVSALNSRIEVLSGDK